MCHISLEKKFFFLDLISIRDLERKLWASEMAEVLIWKILKLNSFGTKWYMSVTPMAKHREYYKGEGGVFPQV